MRKIIGMFEETTDRDKGLSGIKELTISVKQDPYGYYILDDRFRESTYTKSTLPRYAQCCNPRCRQGGLDLQTVAMFAADGERTISCQGHEGSPKGRRRGDSCDNVFVVTIHTIRE